MSLIIGANLSDRIYIAADTRLSRKTNNVIEVMHDNQLKISYLSTSIIVACVGSLKMSAFLVNKLAKSDLLKNNINYFRKNIEAIIRPMVGEYLVKTRPSPKYADSKVVFLFAGLDLSQPKKLKNFNKIHKIIQNYQDHSQARIDSIGKGKKIEELTQEDLTQLFTVSQLTSQSMKDIIFQALIRDKKLRDGDLEINTPDQKLFSLKIDCEKDDSEKFIIKDYEWGECAVYGGGLDEKIIPSHFFGNVEFNKNSGNIPRDTIPFFYEIRKNFSDSIGGVITNFAVIGREAIVATGATGTVDMISGKKDVLQETDVIGGKIHKKSNGLWIPLIPLLEAMPEEDLASLFL